MYSLQEMLSCSFERRMQMFAEHVQQDQSIWILNDDDGAVMLISDDEDCIPVWPSEEAALLWKSDEWSNCKALAISLVDWKAKWTNGLIQDDICVAVFPIPGEDGLVNFPDQFEDTILK